MVSFLSTGIPELDNAIKGGWRKGGVTLLYGPTIKNVQHELLYQTTIYMALRGYRILYLDTIGTFETIMQKFCSASSSRKKTSKKLREKITKISILDFQEQCEVIQNADELLQKNKIDIIVLNDLITHYHSEYLNAGEEEKADRAQAKLAQMMYQLSTIARHYNIPVITTNYEILKPHYYIPFMGGAAVGYYARTIIAISPFEYLLPDQEVWRLFIQKDPSPHLSCRSALFLIDEENNRIIVIDVADIKEQGDRKGVPKFNKHKIPDKSITYVSTGIPGLDKLIGGWRKAKVTMIYGPTMIGKTSLLIQSAYITALMGYNTLYLDLEGTNEGIHPAEFIRYISKSPEDKIRLPKICAANSLEEQLEHAIKLTRSITYDLVIVDSATHHWYPQYRVAEPSKKDELNMKLEQFMRLIHQYAVTRNSAVVISNRTRRAPGHLPYLGGQIIEIYSNRIIKLMPTNKWEVRRISIEKDQQSTKQKTGYLMMHRGRLYVDTKPPEEEDTHELS